MEPTDLKQARPRLVVVEDKVEAGAQVSTTGSAEILSPKDQRALIPAEPPGDLGESVAAPSAEPPTLVLSVWDIIAFCVLACTLLIALVGVGSISAGDGIETFRFQRGLNFETTLCLAASFLCSSYWLSDVVSRFHKEAGDKGFWPRFDKIACLHPVVTYAVIGIPAAIATLPMSYIDAAGAGALTAVLTAAIGAAPMMRWLYLAGSLSSKSLRLDKRYTYSKDISPQFVGGLATASLFAPFIFAWFAPIWIPVITIISGVCFITLRNIIIQSNPTLHLGAIKNLAPRIPSEGEVQIRYNHFVEIQKWFKQRFALRSPWKLGLLLLILLAAVAGNLHKSILEFFIANMAALSGVAQGAGTASGGGQDLNFSNAVANTMLVISFASLGMALGASAVIAFVRAPRKIAAGKDGLHVLFSSASGKPDQSVTWESIKHIKVARPPGKTSAASDLLIFEQTEGKPLTLKLAAIPSADDREKLLGAIDRFAPQISREAAIEETLRRPADQNYTELWLQALAAPPKREKLKPLVKDAVLSDNRYLVRRELGVGGQGFAYLAQDQRKDKEVVLKEFVLPVFVDINARRQSLESFEKEAKLMTRLDHPQVVKLEGFFVEDHRAYLVLEHIDGQNLRQIVEREGPMSEERIKGLAAQMCTILTYLHDLSPPLVHRDFTPDNLILNKDGTLKLIDFNVAQQVEYATTGTVVGKQAYLPPEQFRGQAVPASDLYAFGATLYFLAGGKDPTPISVARPIKDGLSVSAEMDHLISSLTQMEPDARPVNAQAVADLLQVEDSSDGSLKTDKANTAL
jgi:hypothetical protein